jgi:hypothetical protein
VFRGVGIVWKGLKDTLENLLQFFLYSISWWLCVFSIVLAPPAAVALFKAVDPRIGSTLDRLSVRGFFSEVLQSWRRSWKLALITFPILGLLIYNLWYYVEKSGTLAIFAPAWFVLLMIAGAITLSALALVGLLDLPTLPALRAAAVLTGARLGHVIVVGVLLWALVAVGTVLVVPLFLFLPSTVAATIDRLLLDGLSIPVADPLAPTEERLIEEAQTRAKKKFGP